MSTFEELMHQRAYEIPDRDYDRPVRIGLVGWSNDSKIVNVDWAKNVIQWTLDSRIIESVNRVYGRCNQFELVSGLTDCGIPGIAYHMFSIPDSKYAKTVGIACSKANEYPQFPVDERHIIGDEWGDESEFFIDYIDALVRIGGGEQSHREVAMFRAKYPEKPIIESDPKWPTNSF